MSESLENVFFSFGVLNAITAITAVTGNSIVIHALPRCRSLHGPTKALLGCLALSDLGVGLFLQPVSALQVFQRRTELLSSLEFLNNSTLVRFPTFLLVFVSLLTLTTIAVDRFLALHLRQRYRAVVTTRRLLPLLVGYWIVGALVVVLWLFRENDPKVVLISTTSVSIVCIIISSSAFIRCFSKLRHHQRQVQIQLGGTFSGNRLNTAQYRRSIENMACVYILFLIFYVPYGCTTGVAASLEHGTTRHLIRFISSTVLYLNSTLNPLVYCWRIREIRQIVLRSS